MDGPTLFAQLTYDDVFLLLGELRNVERAARLDGDTAAAREANEWGMRLLVKGPEWLAVLEVFCDWLENALALGIYSLNLRIPQGEEAAQPAVYDEWIGRLWDHEAA